MASIAESESPKTPLIEFPSQANPQEDVKLDRSLHKFEMFLRLFGFCQYTLWSFSLSWLAFLLVGVALPLLIITSSYYSTTDKYQIKRFELEILISESLVAAISLFCISHSLRKYGVRKFFFVDRCEGHTIQFRNEYIKKINNFFRLLAVWVLPCLLLKTAREVTRVLYVQHQDSMCQSVLVLLALLVSWTYSNIIFLSGTALFGLVCNLQVIHFENYPICIG